MFKFWNKQKIILFSTFVFIASVAGVFIIYANTTVVMPDFSRHNTEQKNTVDKPIQPIQPSQSSTHQNFTGQIVPTNLVINGASYAESVPEGSSVYDLMKILNDKKIIFFEGNSYAGIGYFVEEINGLANNPQTEMYWIYYINGKSATIGISNYIIKPDDIITWKYEKSTF